MQNSQRFGPVPDTQIFLRRPSTEEFFSQREN